MWVADDHQDRLYAYDMPANAVLRSLEFTGMNIGSFLPGKFDYTARVPSTTASTKVAAEALSTDGIVTIVPVDADDEADGYQINLESGDNTVTVTDGTDTATYTVVITRTNLATVSDDATLSALSLAGVDISAFSSAVTNYTASVPNSVASTSVTAVGTDTNAKITIVPVDADDQLGGNQVDLAEGPNRVTVTVESSDGNVTEAYTVDVNRASVAAFGWSVVPDFKALASGNATSRAIWSDGETMWVTDLSGRLFAYVLSTMARDVDKDVATLAAAGNHSVNGLWSDGVTIWASDDTDDKIYAYDLATGAHRSGRDFDTLKAAGNRHPKGLWSDGVTMWVSDHDDDKIYAYDLADGTRRSRRDINYLDRWGNGRAAGLWSDDVTLWVADDVDKKVYAYDLATGARHSDLEFNTLDAAGNRSPKGIWSNGSLMWVADNHQDRLYAYNMPASALLRSLEFTGVDIGVFLPGEFDYTARVPSTTASTTVAVEAVSTDAIVTVDPVDADDQLGGHQVDLVEGANRVTVTVVSSDGNVTEIYTVDVVRASAISERASVDVDGENVDVEEVSVDVDGENVDVEEVSVDVDGENVDVEEVSVDVDGVSVWSAAPDFKALASGNGTSRAGLV